MIPNRTTRAPWPGTLLLVILLVPLAACVTLARPYEVIEQGPASIAYRVTAGGSGIAPVGQQVDAAAARHCADTGRKAVLTERSETSEALYLYYACRKAPEE